MAEQSEKLRMVQVVLHWAWDPIGIRGDPDAADEYDSYAPQVLGMLENGVEDQVVADYLTGVVRNRMELRPSPEKDADIAALLRELLAAVPQS